MKKFHLGPWEDLKISHYSYEASIRKPIMTYYINDKADPLRFNGWIIYYYPSINIYSDSAFNPNSFEEIKNQLRYDADLEILKNKIDSFIIKTESFKMFDDEIKFVLLDQEKFNSLRVLF